MASKDQSPQPQEDEVTKHVKRLNEEYAAQVKHVNDTIADPEARKAILEDILQIHRDRLKSVLKTVFPHG
jgi:hypothetical protein